MAVRRLFPLMEAILKTSDERVDKVFGIFDESIKVGSNVVIAYSGGKDSTVLAILVYRWAKERHMKGLNLTLLHNDTLSEIDMMEKWAKKFMRDYKSRMGELGNEVTIKIAVPPAIDTFFWRAVVRGYPAPSRNFRWCVKLLKMQPTKNTISDLGPNVVMTGLREFESKERMKLVRQRYGGCPLGPSKCLAYYFLAQDEGDSKKVVPIRDWSNGDVWEFMRKVEDFDISDLLYLYGCDEARYGCWHCTLAKVQWGLHALEKEYLYYDALRLLYRRISDEPSLRMRKKGGYSKLGALNAAGRSMLLHLMNITEEKSKIPIYGLDEAKVDGVSLRSLFFEVDGRKARKLIRLADPKLNPKRAVSLAAVRDIRRYERKVRGAIRRIESVTTNDKTRVLALEKGFDPTKELLDALLVRVG
jgi:DNA sulfur modification protein DndC